MFQHFRAIFRMNLGGYTYIYTRYEFTAFRYMFRPFRAIFRMNLERYIYIYIYCNAIKDEKTFTRRGC